MIYIELDGVLADFDRHFQDIMHCTVEEYLEEHTLEELYGELFKRDPNFFVNIPLYSYSDDLMKRLRYINKVRIMSSIGPLDHRKIVPQEFRRRIIEQKTKWISMYFPKFLADVIFDTDKGKFGSPGEVLIDDKFDSTLCPWILKGGLAVIHLGDPQVTIAWVKNLHR